MKTKQQSQLTNSTLERLTQQPHQQYNFQKVIKKEKRKTLLIKAKKPNSITLDFCKASSLLESLGFRQVDNHRRTPDSKRPMRRLPYPNLKPNSCLDPKIQIHLSC